MTLATLLISLLGGSVALALRHLANVPTDVRRHDARIRDRDDDLTRWIHDDARAVEQDYQAKLQQANAQGVLASGFPVGCRQVLSGMALHRYRDQLIHAQRVLADVHLAERWTHGIWRALRHRP